MFQLLEKFKKTTALLSLLTASIVMNTFAVGPISGGGATGDMVKSTYDANLDGKIDDAAIATALTGKSYNGMTITANSGTFHIANAKAFDVLASVTLNGTDGSTLNVGTGGTLGSNAFTSTRADVWTIAISDETTDLTTGTAKVTFRAPYACTVTGVRLNLNTVSTSGLPTIDINESGTTILSTKLTCDANEKTSTTAATAAVVSDTSLADDAEITIDIDVAGTGAKGAKVQIYVTH